MSFSLFNVTFLCLSFGLPKDTLPILKVFPPLRTLCQIALLYISHSILLKLYKLFTAQLVRRGSVWYSVRESNPSFRLERAASLTDRRTEHIEFVKVVPPILSEPFTLVYKAGKVSVRYLGVLQMIRQLYTDLPISRASNPHPFTVSVVRTNLDSVASLANTLTKLGTVSWTRTSNT